MSRVSARSRRPLSGVSPPIKPAGSECPLCFTSQVHEVNEIYGLTSLIAEVVAVAVRGGGRGRSIRMLV